MELMLLKRLNHPNIVGFKDSFLARGGAYLCIVMSYCDGGDLASRLSAAKGKLFPESQVLHWFVQVSARICVRSKAWLG